MRPSKYENKIMNIGMVWYAFHMIRWPLRKKKKKIRECYRQYKQNGEQQKLRKGILQSPLCIHHQDDNLPTSMDIIALSRIHIIYKIIY
jgi:hypothetical protein